MKKHALIGALIVGAFLYAATYNWGAANNGEEKIQLGQRIQPQTAGQNDRTYEAAAYEETKEGLKYARHSGRSSDTGTRSKQVPPGLGSREANNEGAGGTDRRAASSEQSTSAPQLRQGLPSRGDDSSRRTYAGTFKLTAYTAGPESTGKRPGDPGYGITYSGKKVKEGVTIAADLDVLPLGTVVFIEGIGYRVVMDKGGAVKGKHIDVYIPGLPEAREFGVQEAKVYVIEKGAAQ